MARNNWFTSRVWQHPWVRGVRHAASPGRVARHLSANHRRLPDYIIAGAQKAGTTSLWAYLNEHPLVRPALLKEVDYFDKNYGRGPSWYRMHFPLKRFGGQGNSSRDNTRTGESSPNYMIHPLAPQRVAELVPSSKIIFLLRNPVDRAFSHYQLKLRRRQEPLSFEQAIEAEIAVESRDDEPVAQSTDKQPPAPEPYLRRGRYLEQIQRWEKYFPRAQMLFVESEDFFQNTTRAFQRVLQFLELPGCPSLQFGNRYPGKYQSKMHQSTRRRLVDYFAPFNEQLYAHLGRFDWDR